MKVWLSVTGIYTSRTVITWYRKLVLPLEYYLKIGEKHRIYGRKFPYTGFFRRSLLLNEVLNPTKKAVWNGITVNLSLTYRRQFDRYLYKDSVMRYCIFLHSGPNKI